MPSAMNSLNKQVTDSGAGHIYLLHKHDHRHRILYALRSWTQNAAFKGSTPAVQNNSNITIIVSEI